MMNFIDEEHKNFVLEKYSELRKYGKTDVYYKSVIYVLGICPMTRQNFDKIFNIKEGIINPDSLGQAWQTGSSEKVTRMAFSLWKGWMYDSEEDLEKGEMSSYYNISEIFCCSYAPYFWEGIKIRYPEYTNYDMNNVKIENLYESTTKKADSKSEEYVVALYIRVANGTYDEVKNSIFKQKKELKDYCKSNNIDNIVIYIDEYASGMDNDRVSLKKMINDIKLGKINEIIITDLSRLFRKPLELYKLLSEDFMRDVKVTSLDGSVENLTKKCNNNIQEEYNESLEKFKEIMDSAYAEIIKERRKKHREDEEEQV